MLQITKNKNIIKKRINDVLREGKMYYKSVQKNLFMYWLYKNWMVSFRSDYFVNHLHKNKIK